VVGYRWGRSEKHHQDQWTGAAPGDPFSTLGTHDIIFEWVGEGILVQIFEVRSILVFRKSLQYHIMNLQNM